MNYDLCLHIDSNDPALGKLVMKNANNYRNALPGETFELVIVANGPGVVQFTTKNTELHEIGKPLMEKGVKILLCQNALNDNGLTSGDMWPGTTVVPAGLVEVVRLQREGYAYIKP